MLKLLQTFSHHHNYLFVWGEGERRKEFMKLKQVLNMWQVHHECDKSLSELHTLGRGCLFSCSTAWPSLTRYFLCNWTLYQNKVPEALGGQFVSCWVQCKVVFWVVCLSLFECHEAVYQSRIAFMYPSPFIPFLAVSSIARPLARAVMLG